MPADDPREKLAHRCVGVSVGAAGDGDHRCEFGVAQTSEQAAEAGDDERDHDGRPGVLRGRLWCAQFFARKITQTCSEEKWCILVGISNVLWIVPQSCEPRETMGAWSWHP